MLGWEVWNGGGYFVLMRDGGCFEEEFYLKRRIELRDLLGVELGFEFFRFLMCDLVWIVFFMTCS